MAVGLLFVDGLSADKATKRQARSHVMKGKNAGKTICRRSKLAGFIQKQQSRSSTIVRRTEPEPEYGIGHIILSLAVPVEVTPAHAHAINKFFNSTTERMYPVHAGISVEGLKHMWLQLLFADEISYRCNLALIQTCNDVFDSDGSSPKALHSVVQSFPHVQKVLNSDLALTNAGLATVLSLVVQEMIRGCSYEMEVHFRGLVRMVQLRGGLDQLEENPVLVLKICKIDIVCALKSGNEPIFFRHQFPELLSRTSFSTTTDCDPSPYLRDEWDTALASVFQDAMSFCSALQDPSRLAMDLMTFQEIVISLCYRLLLFRNLNEAMEKTDSSSVAHLGLVLFSMTTFLQCHGRQIMDFPLVSECLSIVLRIAITTEKPELTMWLCLLGGMWMPEGCEKVDLKAKLAKIATQLGAATWNDAKTCLRNYPWINAIHDGPGQTFWDQRLAS